MPLGDLTFDHADAARLSTGTGPWQVLELSVVGDVVSATLNGEVLMRTSGVEQGPGYIGLHGETGALEFREIAIRARGGAAVAEGRTGSRGGAKVAEGRTGSRGGAAVAEGGTGSRGGAAVVEGCARVSSCRISPPPLDGGRGAGAFRTTGPRA